MSVGVFVYGIPYPDARDGLDDRVMSAAERHMAERELRGLRDRLVVNYLPLVKYVAGRVCARLMWSVDGEDVLSWGVIGLLDAIETFDPGRRTKFESYAISKIRWSILDELRRADPLTRRVRRWAREVEVARGELAQSLGRAPTEEVARKLGVGIVEYRAFLVRFWQAQVGSLEARLEYDASLHGLVADSRAADPQSAAEMAELRARLAEAIETLGEKERVVTTFYFYYGLTLREIGGALNITERCISQILHRALAKLKEALPEGVELSGWW